jgi:nucleoside-diphosphate-sugar epimerase
VSLLITGATGFIGKHLIAQLDDYGQDIYVIVRSYSLKKAAILFGDYPQIKIISGDLTNVNVLDDFNDIEMLKSVDTLIHLGGKYNIQMNVEEAYLHNILGTQNILSLSKNLPLLEKIHFVSSFSVIGTKKQKADAHCFSNTEDNLSPYAESKMITEKMVRKFVVANKSLSLVVYRPGIVIPGSLGKLEKIDGPYYFIEKLIKSKKLLNILPQKLLTLFPFDREAYLPLVTVDSVAKFMGEKIKNGSNVKTIDSFYILSEKNIKIYSYIKDVFKSFGKDIYLKPIYLTIAGKMYTKIGVMPKELLGYGYFRTTLTDDKTDEEKEIINTSNLYKVTRMIEQTKDFMPGVSND